MGVEGAFEVGVGVWGAWGWGCIGSGSTGGACVYLFRVHGGWECMGDISGQWPIILSPVVGGNQSPSLPPSSLALHAPYLSRLKKNYVDLQVAFFRNY